ncbi:ATP-dependent DNA helicase Q4 [Chanos chanos]|uniref:ATP-dependent DNA helicase Q4 n=1 Tax=Chanos chanos TaxID=29144 RepID=A0A6J2WIY9_CHACN|nr:ATP-dependent DNA helicase Q4 [Chanos chanos]
MDRYNDVKIHLKKWEHAFMLVHNRKPNKDDIDRAPEETKKLYMEYRTLKAAKEKGSTGHEHHPPNEISPTDSGCWGSHLNRKNMPVVAPKLTSKERDSLQASAQYFGMKLKSNLGALTKDRPLSLKKSFTPGRTPLKSWKDNEVARSTPAEAESPQPKPANTSPTPLASPAQTTTADWLEEPTEPLPVFTPSKSSSLAMATSNKQTPKTQLLRHSVTKRLASVDSGWLQRCQVFDELGDFEKPAVGNLGPTEKNCVPHSNGKSENVTNDNPVSVTPPDKITSMRSQPFGDGTQIGCAISPTDSPCVQNSGVDSTLRPDVGREDRESGSGPTGETQMEPEESSPVRDVKRPRPRAKKAAEKGQNSQADDDDDGKKTGKKRRRETDDKEDETRAGENGETAKKRGRTRKGEAAGENPPKKRRKNKGKETEEGEGYPGDATGTGKAEATKKRRIPQENLLGEVEEDKERASSARVKSAGWIRPTKNSNGNFVKINLKKKSHVKGFALRGAALRKQMYMQKFQLKGERFGGGAGRGGGRFGGFSRQGDSCYKCGGTGHWARDCRGRVPAPPVDGAQGQDNPAEEEEPFELPTLEEVARATGTLRSDPIVMTPSAVDDPDEQDRGEEILLNVIRPDYERPAPPPPMEPLYRPGVDGKVQAVPPEVYEALRDFGYKSFRPGQETAIMRILSGLSTLVVLSTGMGKSLCYQLPAYLYAQRSKCITLVVSPLVSLMDDQLSGLPPKLKAACIHSNMSQKQRETAIEKVKAGQVHVLLLSPEALVGGGQSSSGCLPPADQLPPVAFACIDEAHCVSEWSHNFRPCYLRLCKVLRERLGVRCLLGLTATATLSTALDIARHLDIGDQDGIAVRSAAVPPNLHLSVSMDRDKDQALVSLLKGERFGALESIIVYCTRREETSRIAALLRTCLQGVLLRRSSCPVTEDPDDNPVGKKKKALARKKIRKPLKWIAESYHAGMSASERRRVQNNFMCGELRVVVATVAFGMGLDKSDVRGIVHYNMPRSFESYVQEIGRAGRDGKPAHCHLFLDPEGADLHELRRHVYADTVDYITVKKLVQKVFPPCKCKQIHQKHQDLAKAVEVDDSEMLELMDRGELEESITPQSGEKNPDDLNEDEKKGNEEKGEREGENECVTSVPKERVCHTHERAIPIQETVDGLDITEEGLETLLCYLELHPQRWVELLHPTLSVCRLACYGGPPQLRRLTKLCPPVAVVLARKRMAGEKVEGCSSLEFDVVELADTMGWQVPLVKRGLRQLQWSTDRGSSFGGTGRSGILVEFSALSFYFRSYGDLTAEEMDEVCGFLHGRVVAQERTQLYQLRACFTAFRSVAFRNCSFCMDELDEDRSLQLKGLLADYFEKRRDLDFSKKYQEDQDEEEETLNKCKLRDWEEQIRADIRGFLSSHSDEKFSGRAVARIFHGIGSPCYPAQIYGRDRRYWRKYLQFDFNGLVRLATREIIRTR